ncbi:unnamed protein product [Rangifer tarandus platyrhynchus]|uniref:Uncharacterized protein n=2 Tax=Rangifer tarandus platyrhynchus TaxID=3082113 RepID=A0ABN8YYH3_RANTA|nr:unnamed protein product [Rangifer tarandus platyrhynchus]
MCRLCFSRECSSPPAKGPLHECQCDGILSFIGKAEAEELGSCPPHTKTEPGRQSCSPRWRGKALREAGQPSRPRASPGVCVSGTSPQGSAQPRLVREPDRTTPLPHLLFLCGPCAAWVLSVVYEPVFF